MIQVENYISNQTVANQEVLYILRELIMNHDKGIEEQFKWKIPFYKYNRKGLCYLNVNPKGVIEMGLIKGSLLKDDWDLLKSPHLKQIRHLKFSDIDTINFERVEAFLKQSIELMKR